MGENIFYTDVKSKYSLYELQYMIKLEDTDFLASSLEVEDQFWESLTQQLPQMVAYIANNMDLDQTKEHLVRVYPL